MLCGRVRGFDEKKESSVHNFTPYLSLLYGPKSCVEIPAQA